MKCNRNKQRFVEAKKAGKSLRNIPTLVGSFRGVFDMCTERVQKVHGRGATVWALLGGFDTPFASNKSVDRFVASETIAGKKQKVYDPSADRALFEHPTFAPFLVRPSGTFTTAAGTTYHWLALPVLWCSRSLLWRFTYVSRPKMTHQR